MLKLTVRRLLVAIPLLIVVSLAMFLMLRFVPGDPAATIAGDNATPEGIAEIRERMGLDEPLHEQYLTWLGAALHGDLGTSLFNNQTVVRSISDRLPPTVSLTLAAGAIALVVGVTAGTISAQRPGSFVDRSVNVLASVGLAIPTFWLGLLMIVLFTYKLHWLPPTGYSHLSDGVGEWAKSIAMPAIALGIPSACVVARQTRSVLLDVMERDFIRAARARGASKLGALLKHGLKNAAAPIITVFGIELIGLVGGSIIVEAVFNVPGIGNLAITAVQRRDFPKIQGLVVITGIFIIIVNLVVDLLYAWVNPRGRDVMTTTPIAQPEGAASTVVEPANAALWRRLIRDPTFVIAVTFVLIVTIAAVLAPVLAPYDPLKIDLSNVLKTPSRSHWLGTDDLGRDVLSRILYGARLSLTASAIAIGVAFLLGFPLGLFAGFRGGRWEAVALRIGDGVMALPALIVILAVLTVLGNGLTPAMVALGFVLFPTFLRLTRGVAQSIRSEPYIDAARVLGLPRRRIVRRHVMPHVLPALIVHTSLMLGVALLVEAGLSFVGLGTQPPRASWGAMLSKAQSAIRQEPFIVFPPGLAITLTVLALNVLGDGLRDAVGQVERPRRVRGPASPRRAVAPAAVTSEIPAALEIRGLTIGFPVAGVLTPVVENVTFSVGRGEIVGLVGESGCGKTVTALASIGLVTAPGQIMGGSIRLDGHELVGTRERDLRKLRGDAVAMVFQDPSSSLDPAYTVGDQIGESLRIHRNFSRRQATARAVELLDQVGIANSARRVHAYPHEFSGGMAQRVAVASALACDPKLLIADEPTTALDVTVQSELLDLLRQLQAERDMAILFVTHDLGVIADLCQRAIVMYAGEVVETAPVTDLFADPQHPYSAALLAALPRTEHKGGLLPTIAGKVPLPGAWGQGCHFADRCALVMQGCREQKVPETSGSDLRTVRCLLAQSRESVSS